MSSAAEAPTEGPVRAALAVEDVRGERHRVVVERMDARSGPQWRSILLGPEGGSLVSTSGPPCLSPNMAAYVGASLARAPVVFVRVWEDVVEGEAVELVGFEQLSGAWQVRSVGKTFVVLHRAGDAPAAFARVEFLESIARGAVRSARWTQAAHAGVDRRRRGGAPTEEEIAAQARRGGHWLVAGDGWNALYGEADAVALLRRGGPARWTPVIGAEVSDWPGVG